MHRLLVVRGPIDAEELDIAQWSEHEDGLEGHCAKGMRFENDPNNGDVPHDTVCKDCVLPADVNGCNGDGYDCDMWSGFPCKPKMPHGAIFNDCAASVAATSTTPCRATPRARSTRRSTTSASRAP